MSVPSCCVFHDMGLCIEDIVDSYLKKGRAIDAIKLLKDYGFTLKEAKGLVERIIEKRYVKKTPA